ncbi:MAG: tRNA (adenosine(37)-N6)-dimethylallyltransferase MiaA [Myxococcaceae bacterium]|nr:tRNA (adenosine(37)-N6)-dimethylallyltransferase MiaA [Myxococcaceae bacterium]MBH2006432.1 tRNA (adenosine(37)-N6)-dimethylallyltransferase MiaA [Myxococcaceae bacterium]
MVSSSLEPLVIAGPTGCGKSAWALQCAQEQEGELICADSRQIFQRMGLGTACPSEEDYAQVRHHGFERLDPRVRYSAGQFIVDTDAFVREIQGRGKRPILVGGTGLYLRAWRFGLEDVLASDPLIRQRLEQERQESLYARLLERDPHSAAVIQPTDRIRTLRALEVLEMSGRCPSALRTTDWQREPRVQAAWVLLWPSVADLDARLRLRVERMFLDGLAEEALALRSYLAEDDPALRLKTPGYCEAFLYLDGEISLGEAKERVFRRHRQYAKRQRTWFQKEAWWRRVCSVNDY